MNRSTTSIEQVRLDNLKCLRAQIIDRLLIVDEDIARQEKIVLTDRGACKKCGGAMKSGKAIAQTWTGLPDFPGDKHCVTLSPGGSGKLIDCVKCEKCGWSATHNVKVSGGSPNPK